MMKRPNHTPITLAECECRKAIADAAITFLLNNGGSMQIYQAAELLLRQVAFWS
jgi:hypothetical protein